MSRKNVEIVRAGFAAWNAGDMEAFGQLLDSTVVLRPVENWPEPGPFYGRETVVSQFKQAREVFEADAADAVGNYIAHGDRVAVRHVWRGSVRGPEIRLDMTGVYTLRDGKAIEIAFYWNHAEALETLGLSE